MWSGWGLLHPLPEGKGRHIPGWGTSAGMVSLAQVSPWPTANSCPLTCPRVEYTGTSQETKAALVPEGVNPQSPWAFVTTGACLKFNGVLEALNNPCCSHSSSTCSLSSHLKRLHFPPGFTWAEPPVPLEASGDPVCNHTEFPVSWLQRHCCVTNGTPRILGQLSECSKGKVSTPLLPL